MAKKKSINTMAIRVLKNTGSSFNLHIYKFKERGGTNSAANYLGVDEHIVIKTLVFEKEDKEPILVLMHGDKEVSTKALAAI